MGLASALSTALTGLTAAETTIDVVGNNLANSNTMGFKSSKAAFATQFLQTMSLGSSPTADSGGTNPRQTGLGTMVAEITPNFNQGTIQISSNPLDMAIQGDGFFIVEDAGGGQLYTRNGIFKLNSESQVTTITGNRVMGFGINDDFEVQRTHLVPLEIRLGGAEVAQPTENVFLEGTLTSEGTIADTAEIIQSAILGDGSYTKPAAPGSIPIVADKPNELAGPTAAAGAVTGGGAAVPASSDFFYKVVFSDRRSTDGAMYPNTESMASGPIAGSTGVGEDSIVFSDVPTDLNNEYRARRIYRTAAGGADTDPYNYVGEILNNTDTFFTDIVAVPTTLLVENPLDGNFQYQYYVTFANVSSESRPSPQITAPNIGSTSRIQLLDLPVAGAGDGWTERRIYRNTVADPTNFYYVDTISDATTASLNFTDSLTDTAITTVDPTKILDFYGPPIDGNTLLTDVITYDSNDVYTNMFQAGTLTFAGQKGGRTLATKEFTITATSIMSEIVQFMEQSLGIQTPPGPDATHLIPDDGPTGNPPGGSIDSSGRVVFVSNNGVANSVNITTGSLKLTTAGSTETKTMGFASTQTGVGTGAVTDFLAYDSLGMSINVRLTAVLESQTSSQNIYRWFADSPQNQPVTGSSIAVGTGLIYFDDLGSFDHATSDAISIYRRDVPSASPLEVNFDFSELSGLASTDGNASLAVTRQDGSPPGTLTSFIISEDGIIRGVFSNGITRELGQLRLARFTNPVGLEQKGENLFAAGVNSGLPIQGNPNSQGIGSIVTGAAELSNTDIGSNLIDLILASTMYRGNTRVITTSQEMLEELLSLRR